MTHLRLALRSLSRTPLVTFVAVASLALGIGANGAIFSLFEQMVLRPLPVDAPERLVNLTAPGPKSGSLSTNLAGDADSIFSYPMFRDLEEAQTVFTGIAAHCAFGANLAYGADTLSGQGLLVSGSYFEVLGVKPAAGRLFDRDDDRNPGAHPLVVLAHSYWRTRFDADPDAVGASLVVNGRPMTIIGVAPRGFRGTTLGQHPQVYVPISMRAAMVPGWDGYDDRRSYWIYLFARLNPGMAPDQAEAAVNVPYRGILREVELALQTGASQRTLEQFADKSIVLEPGARGQSQVHGVVATPMMLLLGVTGFVLLIACANVANLLLVKAAQRAHEIAVRLSIGARRLQVVALLLAESFLLAVLGGACGFLVARVTLRLLASLLPSEALLSLDFDLRGPAAWLFLGALVLVAGLVGLEDSENSRPRSSAGLGRPERGVRRSSVALGRPGNGIRRSSRGRRPRRKGVRRSSTSHGRRSRSLRRPS